MEDNEITLSQNPCNVCGERKLVFRVGFFYCIECGTRSGGSQPLLDYTVEVVTGITTRLKMKPKTSDKSALGQIWSSWHAFNMILVGLTNELGACCSKEHELKKTCLKLWGMYLKHNRIAFFSKKDDSYPKLPYKFHMKDLQYLYDIKKPIEKKKAAVIGNEYIERRKKKRALVLKNFKDFTASQASNAPMIASQTLADLTQSQKEKPKSLSLTTKATKLFSKLMTRKELELHKAEGFCKVGCKCLFQKRDLRVRSRINALSITNLYSILILALRINDDDVQLGDVLRWCREEHISYGDYQHFFPEDMVFKKGDPKFKLYPQILSHFNMRKTAADFARIFKLKTIRAPDFKLLIQRYLKELELPYDLCDFILRLLDKLGPLPDYVPRTNFMLPNYEGIALSYIIVTIKILFGLDDVTEKMISVNTDKINNLFSLPVKMKIVSNDECDSLNADFEMKRLFVWTSWVNYIEYRKICLSQCHYPTKIRLDENDFDNPELFLHHIKTTKKDFEEEYVIKDKKYVFIKEILDGIEDNYNDTEEKYPTFSCSLNPMSSYVGNLISWNDKNQKLTYNKKLLGEDFTDYNILFLFDPKPLQNLLKAERLDLQIVRRREGDNTEDFSSNLKGKSKGVISMESQKDVQVIDCTESKWADVIKHELITEVLNEVDSKDNRNRLVRLHDTHQSKCKAIVNCNSLTDLDKIKLNVCYKDYWIRHYTDLDKKFTSKSFEKELNEKFPRSFSWLLRECAAITEMTSFDLYKELCKVENKLIQQPKKS